jgi:RNA polymerase sigma-70 factor (ECF subfamily)
MPDQPRRATVYCIVPQDLAGVLHEVLRRHYASDLGVEVVVEQRACDRRDSGDRRAGADTPRDPDRRRIRADEGRRIGQRRATMVAVGSADASDLPRKARPHVGRLSFIERIEPSTQQLEDRDTAGLVLAVQAGEPDAFAAIYLRYFDRVYQYLHGALRNHHAAEDVTQQVFVNVLRALPRYHRHHDRPFRAWLFVIVRNHAINHLRLDQRSEPVEPERLIRWRDETAAAELDLSALEWVTDRELVMLIGRLPEAQQQVLLLRFQLDMGTAEIAEILGRNADDVRGLQSRALRFLAVRLTALGRGPDRPANRVQARGFPKYAPVLRGRRFALH